MSAPPTDRQRLLTVAIAALIVLATFAAYTPALHGEFIWDDNQYIRDNPELRALPGLWDIWLSPRATPQYHPLVFTTFWIEYHLWGADTLGYHLINVALHVATALLLWRLLVELGLPGGALAAAIFALHPVHLESVAWIAERKNTLSGVFCLATILAWLRFLAQREWRHCWLALGCFACTLLSKSILSPLPVALLLLTWWKRPADWRRAGIALLPFFILSLAMSAVGWWREQLYHNPPLPLSLAERVLIANRAVWFYVGKLLWPVSLTPIYPRWEMHVSVWSASLLLLTLAVLAGLWAAHRRLSRGPLVAAGYFVIMLGPVLGIIDFNYSQYSFVADHFQYAASAGLIAVLGTTAAVAVQRARGSGRAVASAVIGVLLLVLAVLSWRSAVHYATAEAFWRDTLAKNPQAWKAESNLAATLATQGQFDEAIAHYQAALAIRPDFPEAHNHWGIVLARQGKADEALAQFDAALQINPEQADAHNNAGAVLAQQQKWAAAAQRFAAAVRINPAYIEAYDSWGIVTLKQGRPDEAIEHFEAALRINPNYGPAQQHLAATRRLLDGSANTPPPGSYP